MDNLINITCWTLFIVLIAFEYSPYISTKNIFKKLAILGMAISTLGISQGYQNHQVLMQCFLIFAISALVFFGTCTIRTYWRALQNKNTRRATD